MISASSIPAEPAGDLPERAVVLLVDDEPMALLWFSRTFENEFEVITADSVDAALAVLRERGEDISVLVTDYQMPRRNGLELLQIVQRDWRHIVRLIASAYTDKEVAIAAVNQGQVFRIIEKPLDEPATRSGLREALQYYRAQKLQRTLHGNRAAAMRETLGFLAHELNTPLATVRGYMAAIRERYRGPTPPEVQGLAGMGAAAVPARAPTGAVPPAPGQGGVLFSEHSPGEMLAALAAAERAAGYCISLVSTFVQSAREAYPGNVSQTVGLANLVDTLLNEFPFQRQERTWVGCTVVRDFSLPAQRDLLYLVLCTLTKNAIQALRETPQPRLAIVVGEPVDSGPPMNQVRFTDNGPGFDAQVQAKLFREPVTTKSDINGGMGLIFCRRVVQSLGGTIVVDSQAGQGASIVLRFPPTNFASPSAAGKALP